MAVQAIESATTVAGRHVVKWAGLGSDDTGAPYQPPSGFILRSVQVDNLTSGAVAIEGSIDGVTYYEVASVPGAGAERLVGVSVRAVYFRPVANTAPGNPAVTALFTDI